MPKGVYIRSKETIEKMSSRRKKWYINNPEKAKNKSEKMQKTKILNGTHAGKNNPNYGNTGFKGISYTGPSWNTGLTKEKNQILKEMSNNNIGDKNPYWKGDNVGIGALHQWISKYKPKPDFCEECNIEKPKDLANISGDYKRDINDFEWLCRRCHMKKDGRIYNLQTLHFKGGNLNETNCIAN